MLNSLGENSVSSAFIKRSEYFIETSVCLFMARLFDLNLQMGRRKPRSVESVSYFYETRNHNPLFSDHFLRRVRKFAKSDY